MNNSATRGYRAKFISIVTLLILAGFIVNSLASYYTAYNSVSSHIRDDTLPLSSDNIYSEIQRDLLSPIFISSMMAQDTFLRDWVLDGEVDASALVKYLKGVQDRYQSETAFFVSEKTRRYYHSSGVLATVEKGKAINEWYFRVAQMDDTYEINVDHDTANPSEISVFINYKVFDYQQNFIGATGVGLSLSEVEALIDSYSSKYHRQVYFVDRSGELTLRGQLFDYDVSNETLKILQKDPSLEQLAASKGLDYSEGNHKVYVNLRYIPEFDWFLVIEERDVMQKQVLYQSLALNISLGVVVSVIVLILSWFTLSGYQKRLEIMATTDKLSGALNRHSFDLIFERYVALKKRKQSALSGIILDIDWFKQVNDQHGHLVGDRLIREVADVLRAEMRDSDVICRWGGEEYLILLADCDIASAEKIANNFCQTIAHHTFEGGKNMTASLGVAELAPNQTQNDWLQKMDNALYKAKANGRNRVELA
ncbi:sensor domain-containing diguanylate cyclase [Gayadomonas joobiniege]|uniref:sensor domain-containing diguanylate cyclase n=1 Tax=Gayadomonas joobiniege TaxID=1234606 RepID=UPI00037A598B|nr:sensor domain-containing diguanylate cyclase [Gayadomonas joobiniege]